MPSDEPDQLNYTTVQIQALRLQAHTESNKEVRKLALDKPKFFELFFRGRASPSRLLIKADGGWIATRAASDSNVLATIIRRTYFSRVDGATANEAKDKIESNFNDLCQGPTQSIAEYSIQILILKFTPSRSRVDNQSILSNLP